jgi:hypothetical protein
MANALPHPQLLLSAVPSLSLIVLAERLTATETMPSSWLMTVTEGAQPQCCNQCTQFDWNLSVKYSYDLYDPALPNHFCKRHKGYPVLRTPKKLQSIKGQLETKQQPRPATVRQILAMFGKERRGANVTAEISEVFEFVGVATEPPFASAGLDEELQFKLASIKSVKSDAEAGSGSSATNTVSPASEPEPRNSANSNQAEFDSLEPEDDNYEVRQEPDARPVSSQANDWNLSTLRDKFKRGQLDLQPKYQREYVWQLRPELPSRLIESLLLEIPIPPIYFGKIAGGKLEVIDGQQRLTTLIDFIDNTFALKKLEKMGSLNGKYFRDLSDEHQSKVMDSPIRSVIIDAGKNTELRYEIFERLNRGSMALNEQELRNSLFRGPFNDLLAELEMDPNWRKIRGTTKPESRFVEREIILRFFAFSNRLQYYTGNLKRFLNNYMDVHSPRTQQEIDIQADRFKQTMRNIYTVFGDHAARLYSLQDNGIDGEWESKFSVATLDIQAGALLGKPTGKIQSLAEQIHEQFLLSILTDRKLQECISKQTGDSNKTNYRWNALKDCVDRLLRSNPADKRFFDFKLREQLYKGSKCCKICNNVIHKFEDSTVDHIHPYSRGGKTNPSNAQLTHRSCNARKNAAIQP